MAARSTSGSPICWPIHLFSTGRPRTARDALLMHLVVVEAAVVGDDDRAAECGNARRSRAPCSPSGNRRRRRMPTAHAPPPRSARAAPTACRGPRTDAAAAVRAEKSSGDERNGHHAPFQDSGCARGKLAVPDRVAQGAREMLDASARPCRVALRRGGGGDGAPRPARLRSPSASSSARDRRIRRQSSG